MRRRTPKTIPKVSKEPESKQLTLDRFVGDVEAATRAGDNSEEARTVRMLARSDGSRVSKAIWPRLRYLRDRGVKVVAVFTKFRTKKDERATLEEYENVFGAEAVASNIRVANMRQSDRLSEQLLLGKQAAWTGDVAPNGEVEATEMAPNDPNLATARVSFNMVWSISDEVAKSGAKSGAPKSKPKNRK